jgi:hypothetical protein
MQAQAIHVPKSVTEFVEAYKASDLWTAQQQRLAQVRTCTIGELFGCSLMLYHIHFKTASKTSTMVVRATIPLSSFVDQDIASFDRSPSKAHLS